MSGQWMCLPRALGAWCLHASTHMSGVEQNTNVYQEETDHWIRQGIGNWFCCKVQHPVPHLLWLLVLYCTPRTSCCLARWRGSWAGVRGRALWTFLSGIRATEAVQNMNATRMRSCLHFSFVHNNVCRFNATASRCDASSGAPLVHKYDYVLEMCLSGVVVLVCRILLYIDIRARGRTLTGQGRARVLWVQSVSKVKTYEAPQPCRPL